jgi:hypothetical protein
LAPLRMYCYRWNIEQGPRQAAALAAVAVAQAAVAGAATLLIPAWM